MRKKGACHRSRGSTEALIDGSYRSNHVKPTCRTCYSVTVPSIIVQSPSVERRQRLSWFVFCFRINDLMNHTVLATAPEARQDGHRAYLSPIPIHHGFLPASSDIILHPVRQRFECCENIADRREHYLPAAAPKHLLNDGLSDGFRLEGWGKKCRIVSAAGKKWRLHEARRDDHGADFGRIVSCLQLGAQSLVEAESGGFGCGIIDHLWEGHVRSHRCDGDHHAMVLGDHVREELLDQPIMGQGVHIKRQPDICFGRV